MTYRLPTRGPGLDPQPAKSTVTYIPHLRLTISPKRKITQSVYAPADGIKFLQKQMSRGKKTKGTRKCIGTPYTPITPHRAPCTVKYI